jgi:hypothetical protein
LRCPHYAMRLGRPLAVIDYVLRSSGGRFK